MIWIPETPRRLARYEIETERCLAVGDPEMILICVSLLMTPYRLDEENVVNGCLLCIPDTTVLR